MYQHLQYPGISKISSDLFENSPFGLSEMRKKNRKGESWSRHVQFMSWHAMACAEVVGIDYVHV